MDKITIIGLVASFLTSISMLPQLIKVIKEKKAASVSVIMPIVLLAGLGVWVWYGFMIEDWIIVGANIFSFLLNLVNLIYTIRYKDNK